MTWLDQIQKGDCCYACEMDESQDEPMSGRGFCSGAKWAYHGGAGGLFTYCDEQLKNVQQEDCWADMWRFVVLMADGLPNVPTGDGRSLLEMESKECQRLAHEHEGDPCILHGGDGDYCYIVALPVNPDGTFCEREIDPIGQCDCVSCEEWGQEGVE